MPLTYVGLGSNLGDRLSFIRKAVEEINSLESTEVILSSAVYETEPWGNPGQGKYLNSVIKVNTGLKPEIFLKNLKDLEYKIGREKRNKWTAREIDIDILFYDDEIIETGEMKIPHPQIENRRFVLIPLNEIAPGMIHPGLKKSISALVDETKDDLGVEIFSKMES
jgi:2-amino-4-hydroxy-6-hydroxymethyldihydropteridine diphosphokinase